MPHYAAAGQTGSALLNLLAPSAPENLPAPHSTPITALAVIVARTFMPRSLPTLFELIAYPHNIKNTLVTQCSEQIMESIVALESPKHLLHF